MEIAFILGTIRPTRLKFDEENIFSLNFCLSFAFSKDRGMMNIDDGKSIPTFSIIV